MREKQLLIDFLCANRANRASRSSAGEYHLH
jgi:hypothetical protein